MFTLRLPKGRVRVPDDYCTSLRSAQRIVYDRVLDALDGGINYAGKRMFYVDGPGKSLRSTNVVMCRDVRNIGDSRSSPLGHACNTWRPGF